MSKKLDILPLCYKFAYGYQTVVEEQERTSFPVPITAGCTAWGVNGV